ncbi:MAG: hypothetical protein J0L56_13240 [Chitinophagales bacterium]|nr:hypothetical protein [Chitinophagales bacterium]
MKGYYLLPALLSVCIYSEAAIITWDGEGGDGQWNTASNWSGNIVPAAGDDVILDNSVVTGSYVVNLPAGAVTVTINSLIITATGINTIRLILPVSNTIVPGLDITGTGDALVLNNGAILQNSSGAASGLPISVSNLSGIFRINNGGLYIHNTFRQHAPLFDKLSAAPGTEDGTIEFDVPTTTSYAISLTGTTGRTFGNLILSATASGGARTYTSTGSNPCIINGNFIINSGVTFSAGLSADFIIKGNFNQQPASVYNIQNSTANNFVKFQGNINSQGQITKTGVGLPVLELNGTANQNINISGTITNSVELKINNPAGTTLHSALTLPYRLNLTNGKITTSLTNMLTLADNAVTTGASSLSFVEGPLRKVGDDNFTFPVGVGSMYAPVAITNISGENTSDVFTAEYKRANPQTVRGPVVEPGMDHVSYVEYWTLTRDAGTAVKRVALAVTPTSFCKSLATTYVSRWNGALWTSEGSTNGGVTLFPPYETGTITSTDDISSFGDFTLITDQPFAINPLPVTLVSFDVVKQNNTALLQWELAECCSKNTKFELQRSHDGSNFVTCKIIPGNETSRFYQAMDTRLDPGLTCYRLRIVEENGKISFSRIITVINSLPDMSLVTVMPTLVTDITTVMITASGNHDAVLFITDMQGRVLLKREYRLSAGNTTIQLSAVNLVAGVYLIYAECKGQRTNCIRFIKQ